MADNHKMWEELGMNLELHDHLEMFFCHRRTDPMEWIITTWS